MILNLVRKGFIVFAFDPVAQGERLEYYDPETGKDIVGDPDIVSFLFRCTGFYHREFAGPIYDMGWDKGG